MTFDDFQFEKRVWDGEVDAEAAALVRRGVPPYRAVERAVETVSARRAKKHEQDIDNAFRPEPRSKKEKQP